MKAGERMKTVNLRTSFAIAQRYLYTLSRDRWLLFEMFYWPAFDIALYGYVSAWIGGPSTTCTVVSAVVFWHAMLQANFAVARNFLGELTSGGITNLFATTLSLREWIAGCAMLVVPISMVVFCLCNVVSYLVFGCLPLAIGLITIPLLTLLMVNALSLGLISATLLTQFGLRVQATIFIIGWALALAGGAYYPIGLLPSIVQNAARLTPLPYLFAIIRTPDAVTHTVLQNITMAAALSLAYLALAILIFRATFRRSLRYGLARLTF